MTRFRERAALRGSAWTALVFFTLIIVTGAAVRLTGSGLGCSRWPNCSDQSLTPQSGHAFIEFGNRLITTPVALSALAVLICAVMQNQRRQDYVKLGWSLVAIVAAQALLGAVAVWTELNWVSVAGHFLLSMVSLTICVVLVWRIEQERRTTPSVPVDGKFSLWSRAVASLGFAVIALGTLVTASGPYAGGEGTGDAVRRFSAFGGDTFPEMVMLHARAAAVFGALVLLLWILARMRGAAVMTAALTVTCIVVAVSGVVGQIQYHVLDYPAALVWSHVALSAILWSCCVWIWLSAGPQRS